MKKIFFGSVMALALIACESPEKEKTAGAQAEQPGTPGPSVTMPYTATYSSQYDDSVSDQDVQTVLNSYKYWEEGDMNALAGTLADSITFISWDGFQFAGPKAGLLDRWSKYRDSLSSVKIEVAAWTKQRSLDKKDRFVDVWYKEIDTYKSGKVDSFNFSDINVVANGKIVWYSQYRQALKK